MGRQVNAASRSFAVALTACTTPAAGKPGFDLPEDEMEVGVGIHGEPGRSREKLRPANEIVAASLDAILDDLPAVDAFAKAVESGATLAETAQVAADAAENGMRATIAMIARKGACLLSRRPQRGPPGSGGHVHDPDLPGPRRGGEQLSSSS